jgi:ribosomal protein L11 methyltransferase
MAWLEITLRTAQSGVDNIVTALTAAGFEDLVIEDQGEFEQFLDKNRAYWDYIDESLQQHLQGLSQIKLYLEDTDTASFARLTELAQRLQLPMDVQTMEQTNWEEAWKENYPPQSVGEKLLVLPYWLAEQQTGDRLPVILDPGLTFGTGAHPSTQMVMEIMEQTLRPGGKCLDLGSGSGILSIAALRLGAVHATGVDIDPKAEDIARENAAYNGYDTDVFTACTGNVTADRALMERLAAENYDLVLVNIVADVIIALAPVLPRFLTKDSTLICSGILDTRLTEVIAALEAAGLTITAQRAKEDWLCVSAKRR